jgi:hypothetical protein
MEKAENICHVDVLSARAYCNLDLSELTRVGGSKKNITLLK